jgi:hypothetical protein
MTASAAIAVVVSVARRRRCGPTIGRAARLARTLREDPAPIRGETVPFPGDRVQRLFDGPPRNALPNGNTARESGRPNVSPTVDSIRSPPPYFARSPSVSFGVRPDSAAPPASSARALFVFASIPSFRGRALRLGSDATSPRVARRIRTGGASIAARWSSDAATRSMTTAISRSSTSRWTTASDLSAHYPRAGARRLTRLEHALRGLACHPRTPRVNRNACGASLQRELHGTGPPPRGTRSVKKPLQHGSEWNARSSTRRRSILRHGE